MYRNLKQVCFEYERNEVLNMSPVEIIARLYHELGKTISNAKEALMEKNIALKGENIGRAVSIIRELQASLDMEKGREIASNLNNLYAYLINELTMANLKNEVTRIDTIIKTVDPLTGAWNELARKQRETNRPAMHPVEHDHAISINAAY